VIYSTSFGTASLGFSSFTLSSHQSYDVFTDANDQLGGMGNDISWFILRDPSSTRQFLFYKNTLTELKGFFVENGFC
jgi:hypothetical protein